MHRGMIQRTGCDICVPHEVLHRGDDNGDLPSRLGTSAPSNSRPMN